MALVSGNMVAHYFVAAILVFIVGESILLFIFVPKIHGVKTRTRASSRNVRINMPSNEVRDSHKESVGTRESATVLGEKEQDKQDNEVKE